MFVWEGQGGGGGFSNIFAWFWTPIVVFQNWPQLGARGPACIPYAQKCTATDPSTNLPMLCPVDGCQRWVWWYVLPQHYETCHPDMQCDIKYDLSSCLYDNERKLLNMFGEGVASRMRRKGMLKKASDADDMMVEDGMLDDDDES